MISIKAVTTARQRDGSPMFVTGCEKGDVIRWDAATGERVGQRIIAGDGIEELEVVERPGGGQLLVGLGECLHRWDPVTGTRVGRPVRVGRLSHLATVYADRAGTPFALLVTEHGDEQLWRLDAGERIDDVPTGLRAVLPDGRWVVAEADGSLAIGAEHHSLL